MVVRGFHPSTERPEPCKQIARQIVFNDFLFGTAVIPRGARSGDYRCPHGGLVSKPTLALDSNVWRYVIDANGVEELRRISRSANVAIVVLPAVLYETLRLPDTAMRRKIIEAQTRQTWLRVMPEAYSEAEELRLAIGRLRPEWLHPQPDLREWHKLRADWQYATWTRARRQTKMVADFLHDDAPIGASELDRARKESHEARKETIRIGVTFGAVKIERLESWFTEPVPGWDGQKFEAWRVEGLNRWMPTLSGHDRGAYADWILPWLQPDILHQDFASWVRFWTRDVTRSDLPRQWIRNLMRFTASTRKVSPGSPVDIQISTYLFDCDWFCTGDAVFVECIEKIRAGAPRPLARTRLLPGGESAVGELFRFMRSCQP